MVNLFYWNDIINAGDYYAQWLATKLYKEVKYSRRPNLVITGSILSWNELNNSTIVWGSGLHNSNINEYCRITNKSNFKAVRGHLTAKKLQLNNITVGDPGILISKYYKAKNCISRKRYCLVCHWKDYEECKKLYSSYIDVISMGTTNIEALADTLNKYELVLSTSLHGIIFAHSYNIPAIHVEFNKLESIDDFKYKDYYSTIDIKYEKKTLTKTLSKDLTIFKNLYQNKNLYKPSQDCIKTLQNNLIKVLPTEQDLNPKYNAVLCAIAKNENNYINDWVEYYLNLGFDHIYLFDNNDSSTPWVGGRIKQIDKVTVFNVNNQHIKGMQLKCYNNFYKQFRNNFNWALFCDIDEYLTGIENINTFLDNRKFKNFEMIRVKWKLFGDDDLIDRNRQIPIYKALTKVIINNSLSNQGKCFVRGSLTNICVGSCHYAFRGDWDINNLEKRDLEKTTTVLTECLPSGIICNSRISIKEDYSNETVYLNHYMTKTLAEFLEQKFNRGDACFDTKQISLDYYWQLNKKTEEKLNFAKNYFKTIQKEIKPAKKPAKTYFGGANSYFRGW